MSGEDERVFEELELTESNVLDLHRELRFDYYVPWAIKVQAFSPSVAEPPSAVVYFDPRKVAIHSQDIDFLFGQLRIAHNKTEKYFVAVQAAYNNQLTAWTTHSSSLMKLFEIGIANRTMMPFKVYNDKFLSMLNPKLLPTLGPSEPQYAEFIKQYKLQYKQRFKIPPTPEAPAKKDRYVHYLEKLDPSEVSTLIETAKFNADANKSLSDSEKSDLAFLLDRLKDKIGTEAATQRNERRNDVDCLNQIIDYHLSVLKKGKSRKDEDELKRINELIDEGATIYDIYDALTYENLKGCEDLLQIALPSFVLNSFKNR